MTFSRSHMLFFPGSNFFVSVTSEFDVIFEMLRFFYDYILEITFCFLKSSKRFFVFWNSQITSQSAAAIQSCFFRVGKFRSRVAKIHTFILYELTTGWGSRSKPSWHLKGVENAPGGLNGIYIWQYAQNKYIIH